MIAEPKPPSGLSPEASWHRQLLRWVKGWFVLSIEGYRITETTNGRVFKKESMQPPISKNVAAGGSVSGLYEGDWNSGQGYAPGAIVRVLTASFVIAGVTYTTAPGIYGCVKQTQANGVVADSKQIPQFPEPLNACWQLIAFAPRPVNVCDSGSKVIYIQSSESF